METSKLYIFYKNYYFSYSVDDFDESLEETSTISQEEVRNPMNNESVVDISDEICVNNSSMQNWIQNEICDLSINQT